MHQKRRVATEHRQIAHPTLGVIVHPIHRLAAAVADLHTSPPRQQLDPHLGPRILLPRLETIHRAHGITFPSAQIRDTLALRQGLFPVSGVARPLTRYRGSVVIF